MTDIEIARSTKLEEIEAVASKYGIPTKELEHYGHYMAKVPTRLIDEERVKKSNLILVTAITPTKAGIGKTTVTIGLALGLLTGVLFTLIYNKIKKRSSSEGFALVPFISFGMMVAFFL